MGTSKFGPLCLKLYWALQANPMQLVSRIKKLQDDIATLKGQCHELLVAKQVLYYELFCIVLSSRGFYRFELLQGVFEWY